MKRLRQMLGRFFVNEDGYVISTESVITATLTICALVIGATALRVVILFVFIDAAEALASRENLTPSTDANFIAAQTVIGPTQVAPIGDKFFPDVGPLINDMVGDNFRPRPTDATKE